MNKQTGNSNLRRSCGISLQKDRYCKHIKPEKHYLFTRMKTNCEECKLFYLTNECENYLNSE